MEGGQASEGPSSDKVLTPGCSPCGPPTKLGGAGIAQESGELLGEGGISIAFLQ